jgi:hypothetical protein
MSVGGAALLISFAVAGCGDGDDQSSQTTPVDVPETVAIGVLPAPLSDTPTLPAPPPPPTTAAQATTTTVASGPIEGPIAEFVSGNRLLMIGDALLSTATPRNDGLMCDAVTLFGWAVEIDAENDRALDFAGQVLDDRLEPDGEDPWDAVALMIGSEIDGADPDVATAFSETLDTLIERIAPRPVILFTLPVVDISDAEINDIVNAKPQSFSNVVVVDFGTAGGDADEVVDETGQALTDDGNKRLSVITAAALGQIDDTEGECLPTDYDG